MTIPVSVIVMTRNEAPNLAGCLQSVSRFDEVFVVDSRSDDTTTAIAQRFGARVVEFDWNGHYPKKKQWSLDNLPLSNDWVLILDADERLTPELSFEINLLMTSPPPCAAYFLRGQAVFLGRRLRFGRGFFKIMLLDRQRCRFPDFPDLGVARMWEVEGHYQPNVAGPIGRLRAPYLHEDRKPLFMWFDRHNRYSDWETSLWTDDRLDTLSATERGGRRILKKLFERLPLRPLLVFLFDYVVCLGILDGRPGLHFALARAFYYWQISVKRLAAVQG